MLKTTRRTSARWMHSILAPSILAAFCLAAPLARTQQAAPAPARHNVILFVADGLRRDSINAEDMPTFLALRKAGVDFRNSHSSFPTFTTANASVIATGHGLGDTGDFSNVIYPGLWLSKPDTPSAVGQLVPFLENDGILADMNAAFQGNYLGERTLLSAARQAGYNVASVGKLGPAAIQQVDALRYDSFGALSAGDAIILDDSTGSSAGIPLPVDVRDAIEAAGLSLDAPTRTNGFGESSQWSAGFSGDAKTPGSLVANLTQQQWFSDVSTKVLLPKFAAESPARPFILLFWSRDPDGVQHYEGDSLQQLKPGINGPTVKRGLRNADHCLKQLLDWLDAHPALKATTDVLVTSDHGFATISRREIAPDGTNTGQVSSALDFELSGKEATQPKGTLPTGFLAVDLAVGLHLRLFDSSVRSATGDSVFQELQVGGERSQHPSNGNALLGETIQRADGSDARLIVASNGGSDLIYVPSSNPALAQQTVRQVLAALTGLDYVGGLFVDDKYCTPPAGCPGALPLSDIGLVGASKLPRPAIVVSFKLFYQTPGDLLSAVQISDTTLQEGQGMHGGFGRDQTFNNMAAIGPDFKSGFVDQQPMGNIDITPTLAHVLGLELPAVGTLRGRIVEEALKTGAPVPTPPRPEILVSPPAADGSRTVLYTQQSKGVHYYDKACFVSKTAPATCP